MSGARWGFYCDMHVVDAVYHHHHHSALSHHDLFSFCCYSPTTTTTTVLLCAAQVFDDNHNLALAADISRLQIVIVPNIKGVRSADTVSGVCKPDATTAICQISTATTPFPKAWFEGGSITIKYGFENESPSEMKVLAVDVPVHTKTSVAPTQASPVVFDIPDATVVSGEDFVISTHTHYKAGEIQSAWVELTFSEADTFKGAEYDASAWNVHVSKQFRDGAQIVNIIAMMQPVKGENQMPSNSLDTIKITCASRAGQAGRVSVSAKLKFLGSAAGNLVYDITGGYQIPVTGRIGGNSVFIAPTASQSQIINQNGATSGFEMYFAPSTFGAGGPNQNTSRIQHKGAFKPHCMYPLYV